MKTEANHPRIAARKGLIVVGIATGLMVSAIVVGCSKAKHYRAHHDAESLYATLHKDIKPGDSIERVEELLGIGEPPRNPEKLVAVTQKFAQRSPQSYPDGVRDGDVFLGYRGGNQTLYLQFREGRLINFNAKDFEQIPELTGVRSD